MSESMLEIVFSLSGFGKELMTIGGVFTGQFMLTDATSSQHNTNPPLFVSWEGDLSRFCRACF